MPVTHRDQCAVVDAFNNIDAVQSIQLLRMAQKVSQLRYRFSVQRINHCTSAVISAVAIGLDQGNYRTGDRTLLSANAGMSGKL